MARTRIIAHRGASYAARENTLAAFRLGLEEGADGLEGDFHLTADGIVVCHHDAKLGRVFPGREAVRSTPLSRLRAASGGELPTLAEFLALLPIGIEAFLELKTGPEIVAPIRAALEDWGQPVPGLTLMSFSVATVRAAQAAFPESTVNWLVDLKRIDDPAAITEEACELGVDGVGLSASRKITASWLRPLFAAGLQIHVWTVDQPKQARHYADLGIASITTNRPALIRAALNP